MSNPYIIRTCVLPNGDHIPLLCRDGLPCYEPTDWTLRILWPEGNASNTIEAKLRSIGHWFRYCEEHGFDWQNRVRTGEFMTQNDIDQVIKWLSIPIGTPPGVKARKLKIEPGTLAARMTFLGQYLRWIGDRITHGIQGSDHARVQTEYDLWKGRWKTRIPATGETKDQGERFGLNEEQQNLFLSIIDPKSPRNPFEPKMRLRNHAMLLMLFDHGIRMGEPLMLKTSDLYTREHQFRVPGRGHDPKDPRIDKPSQKKGKNKRHGVGRRLEFTVRSQRAMEVWLNGDRRNDALFPGGRKSPFVFLSEAMDPKTGGRRPISVRRFHDIFQDLRKTFPELGERFSPHILRHTYVEEYIRAHPNFTPKERQDLCFLLGWSLTSIMPDRYGMPAIVESGGKRSRGLSERRHERALKRISEDEEHS